MRSKSVISESFAHSRVASERVSKFTSLGKRILKEQHGSSSDEHLGNTAKVTYWASFVAVKRQKGQILD